MRPNKASDFCMIFKSSFWGCKIRACVRGRSHSSARSDKSLEHRGCQGAQGCRNNQCSCSLVPQRCSATVMEIKNHQSCCTGWRVTGCPVWGHDSNPQSWCLDRFCLQKIKISNSSCCCLDNRRTIKGFCSAFMEEQICDSAQCLKKLWPLPSRVSIQFWWISVEISRERGEEQGSEWVWGGLCCSSHTALDFSFNRGKNLI